MFAQPKIPEDVYENELTLFVLMTLVIHDGLTLEEISTTLYVDIEAASAQYRLLLSSGLRLA